MLGSGKPAFAQQLIQCRAKASRIDWTTEGDKADSANMMVWVPTVVPMRHLIVRNMVFATEESEQAFTLPITKEVSHGLFLA
jgi:hypothetical protein